jgi:hypothetical protein
MARHLSDPDSYGFGSSGVPDRSVEEHRESIRVFLAMIDPNTGFIGDDWGERVIRLSLHQVQASA